MLVQLSILLLLEVGLEDRAIPQEVEQQGVIAPPQGFQFQQQHTQ
jgi:hypothetical protein